MQTFQPAATNNHILSRLTADETLRLGPHLRHIEVKLGDMLLTEGQPIDFLFFPEYSLASVVGSGPAGESAEIGLIGGEGVVGTAALLSGGNAAYKVNIQLPGTGYRLSAAEALKEFALGGSFHDNVLRFVESFLTQVCSTAMSNALHTLDERLPRWLLTCDDRYDGEHLPLTQDFLALMVGAGRPSVSIAANAMQAEGMISYSRGKITINDRAALIQRSCGCYTPVTLETKPTSVAGSNLN